MKFNVDTGAAATAFPLDPVHHRPEQHRHRKDTSQRLVTVFPTLEERDRNAQIEPDVNGSITDRYTDVRKILASASQVCNEGKQ